MKAHRRIDGDNGLRLNLFSDQIQSHAAILTVLMAGLVPRPVHALPADPQRPFDITSCADAKLRFREALAGSPLISDAEMAIVVATARDWTEKLCGPDVVQEIMTEFDENN